MSIKKEKKRKIDRGLEPGIEKEIRGNSPCKGTLKLGEFRNIGETSSSGKMSEYILKVCS